MSNKKVKINVGLDFTADNMSLDKIKDQMDLVFKAMKINLDPAEYKKVEAQLKKLGELAKANLNQSTGKMNFKGLDNAISNNHDVIRSFDRLTTTMKQGGVVGDETFNKITTANEHFKKGLVESNGLLSKMGTTLMNTIRWNISASAINAVTGELQRAYGFAKDLDRSLTDIRIVSGLSADNMSQFAVAANKSARELKVSTIDYAQAALIFYQQGLNAMEVQNMTKAAIIGGNITGESTEEMSNLLTSVMNGYKIATEDVLKVTDKLAAVGAETAADFYELATAMSKVASMANAAGVPIDQLNAQIATIVSVTKESPESIGTSLKTIYGRMLAFKVDSDALMKDEDGEVFGAPKVEEALQAYNKVTGAQISLFKVSKDGKRELRELGDVITEIGDSWGSTNDNITKFGLSTALAGSRQQNRLVALFDSWDMYKESVTTSLEAEGTSLLQNAIYMDSYDAKLKGLQATKEALYMSVTNTDGLKNLVDALTSIIKTVTKISEVAGGLNIVFGMVAATLAKSGIDKIANMTMPSFSVGTGKGDPTTEELETGKQLLVIERAYGKEKAETHRLAMKAAIENKALMLERRDMLLEEGKLLDNIEEYETSNETQAYKDRAIATLIEENQHLSITEQEILNIQKAYSALEHERANLKVLMEEAGGEAASEVLQAKIDASRKAIEDMESSINKIHNTNTSDTRRAEQGVELTKKIEQDEIRKINELEAAARKTTTATVALQTGLMMLPSVIGAVGDSSKTTGDVLRTVGTTAIPALTSGLMKSIPAMVAAAGKGASIGAAMLPVMGPILAVAGAIGILAVAAKKFAEENISFKDAFGNLEGASNELEQVKAGYDTLSQKLVDIATRLREINTIQREGGLKAADSEALDREVIALTGKRTELEQQLIIENLLISAAEKKLELAARETAEAKMKSEYSEKIGDRATVDEELERSIKAYQVAGLMVKSYQRDIAALDTESKTYEKDLAKLTASMEKQEGIRNTAKQNIALHSAAIKKIVADLKTEDGANKGLIESLEGALEAGLAVAEADLAASGIVTQLTDDTIENTEAVDANRIAQEEKDEAMQKLIDAYDEVTNKIKTYNDFLYELNTSEELSAKTKQEIILKHAELAPYIENEQELRKQLIKLIEAEEQAQIDAYVLMMMSSEEFFNGKLKGNKDLADELRKAYNIELDDFKSLAEAKAKVEENLISGLSMHWAKYYDNQSKSLVFTQDQWENMTHAQQQEYGVFRGQLKEVANRFEGITLDLAPIDFKKINLGLSGAGSGSKKLADNDKKTKEEYQAEADRYAKINFELDRNNVLLAINKSRQTDAAGDMEKRLFLMNGEVELHKQRQTLLHAYNETLRAEGKALQESLKGTFDFEGSWEDNSVVITNMSAINGKSKEMETDFKRIIAIMKELPQASAEWAKLNQEIQKIELDKMIMGFEEINKALKLFNTEIEDLDYGFKLSGSDEFSDKIELAAKKITVLANSVAQATFDLANMGANIHDVGSTKFDEFIKQQEYLNKVIRDGSLGIIEQEKAWQSLIDTQRKKAQDDWLKIQNRALQDQRDQISALESIQEVIVSIIRKRGEEEKRILDENHSAEIKSLEERRHTRKKLNQEELDEFKKHIQEKLKALEDEYAEEDYIEALDKERNEANRIQREIDVLSLDDSLTARNKVIDLRKQLADQNEKIAKMQQKKERELSKETLTDLLTDKEKDIGTRNELADAEFDKEKERLDSIYEANKKNLEDMYTDAKVYAEARESIMNDSVRVAGNSFKSIYDAYVDFENDFGKGMGILGGIIKRDFLDQLDAAQRAIDEIKRTGAELSRPRDNYDYDDATDDETGYREPDRPSREPDRKPVDNSRPPEFSDWSSSDYNTYLSNKKKFEDAKEKEDLATQNKALVDNMILRQEYWGKGRVGEDNYTYSQLKNYRGYKDGGVINETGLFKGHGSDQSSEVVFSAKTAKKLWEYIENIPKLATSFEMPRMPSMAGVNNFGSERYEINFNIDGNMDRSILPEVKKMIIDGIEKAQEEKISKFKDIGIKRSIR